MTMYLKGDQKYDGSKLNNLDLPNKSKTVGTYRVIQYLIGKLSDIVNIRQGGPVVAELLASEFTKYINGSLLII